MSDLANFLAQTAYPEQELPELFYLSEIWTVWVTLEQACIQQIAQKPFKLLHGLHYYCLCSNLCAHSSLPCLQSSPCNFRQSLSPLYSSFLMEGTVTNCLQLSGVLSIGQYFCVFRHTGSLILQFLNIVTRDFEIIWHIYKQ